MVKGQAAVIAITEGFVRPFGQGVLLLIIFFCVRKLRYHEFTEVLRAREISLLKRRRLANNMAIRKAAAGLKVARDLSTIQTLLEGSLNNEFDAFALVLSDEFMAATASHLNGQSRPVAALAPQPGTADHSTRPKCNGRSVGQLRLYNDAETPILVRAELIRTLLRVSLVQAFRTPAITPFPTSRRSQAKHWNPHIPCKFNFQGLLCNLS